MRNQTWQALEDMFFESPILKAEAVEPPEVIAAERKIGIAPGTDKWVIISTDYDGNPIGLDAEGKVWISDHDRRVIQLLAPNFEAYLRKWCLKLPN